jgi:hypothetical protein
LKDMEHLDCYNNANYNDEALKKCKHLNGLSSWFNYCSVCCNRDICKQYVLKMENTIDEDLFRYTPWELAF